MTQSNNKLELRWHGKDEWESPEPRLLIEKKVYTGEKDGIDDNLLIYGDNLLALKALERDYTGKIKCVYIDPPYNTRSRFKHYNDNLEHSLWLNMIKERLVILHQLLHKNGSIWISIDDYECHYLKVLCDEIFGRKNFIGNIVWQHSLQGKGYSGKLSIHHNHILIYRKTEGFKLKNLSRTEEDNKNYSNPDNDPRGDWRPGDVRNSLVRPNLMYDIKTPSGKTIRHPEKGWRFSKTTFKKELSEGKIIFSPDETRIIRKIYLSDQYGRVPETIWFGKDVGTTREATQEVKVFNSDDVFSTPKPERLLQRILNLATNPGDIVLDSFAGSGTTGSVAQKMGRRWIMIELGEHCHTHIIPRLEKVIEGKDPGGITSQEEWQGGGGFRYCEMAPSLLEKI